MKTLLKYTYGTIFIVLLSSCFLNTASAQKKFTLDKLYLFAGAGGGNYDNGFYDIGLQSVFKKKWSATFSHHGIVMTPKNLPKNHMKEDGSAFITYPDANNMTVKMNLVSLTAGRYFKLGKYTWATAEAGLSFVKGQHINFQFLPNISLLAFQGDTINSYFNSTYKDKSTIGLMLKSDIHWAVSSVLGLNAGVFANTNSIQSPIGFKIGMTIGFMGVVVNKKRLLFFHDDITEKNRRTNQSSPVKPRQKSSPVKRPDRKINFKNIPN